MSELEKLEKGIIAEKAALRDMARRMRNGIDPQGLSDISLAICERFVSMPEFLSAEAVFCYFPLGSEVNTAKIIEHTLRCGKVLALPRCASGGVMHFYEVDSVDTLSVGAYGIMEPSADARKVSPDDFSHTLVGVPALAFDRSGYRIGYGKGYYDRYFEHRTASITLVGLCPEGLILDCLPHGTFDVSVDAIISEKEVIKIEKT